LHTTHCNLGSEIGVLLLLMKYKKGEFITIPNVNQLNSISATAQALFLWLCNYADEEGVCFPSRTTLSNNLNCSVRTVDSHLTELVKAGFLQKEERYFDNKQTSNKYQILLMEGCKKQHSPRAEFAPTPVQKTAHRTKPILTKPTYLSAKAESEYVITSDLEEKPKRIRKVTPDMEAVFNLFNNPAKAAWKLREVERIAAQALFDTHGLETLSKRLARIAVEKKKGDPYFPEVNTPSQLLDKMPNIERYLSV